MTPIVSLRSGCKALAARLIATALGLALGACGGGGSTQTADEAPKVASYTLAVDPPALTVGQGREAWLSVTVKRDAGFNGSVEVSLNQPPAGVMAETLVLPADTDSGSLPVHLAADLPAGSVLALDVTATSGAVTRSAISTLTVSAPQRYAQVAIAAALRAGTIDYGTSLLYRAYALFGDARLPDAYLGAGSIDEDNLLFEQIRQRIAEFTPERQAQLRAFIVRPTDALSVWNRGANASSTRKHIADARVRAAALPPESCATLADGAWVSRRSSQYAVRVWMQCGPAPVTDAVVQRYITATLAVLDTIYVPMTDLLGAPISDFEGGGDNAIDFYIVADGDAVHRRDKDFTPSGLAVTFNETPIVGEKASAFVLIPRSTLLRTNYHDTIIHEFFHVLQNAHNAFLFAPKGCVDDACNWHWFVEASAAWAAAHFDRTLFASKRGAFAASYYRFAEVFQPSDEALNAPDSGTQHDYSAFIWPYFVEQETKGTAFMKQAWNGLGGVTAFDAADDVVSAVYPFDTNFRRFALRNLNHEFKPGGPLPEAERYVTLDAAQFRAADNKEPPYLPGDLVAGSAYSQPLELANLSARYVKLNVKGTTIRKVELDTGALQPAASLIVQALIRTDNGWLAKPVDLVDGKTRFCFDLGPSTASVRGSFREIVLVLSNHGLRKSDKITGELKALPSATPCGTLWVGSIKQIVRSTSNLATTTVTSVANVIFEFDDKATDVQTGEIPFRLKSGTWTFESRTDIPGRNPACRGFATGSGALPLLEYQPLVPSGTSAGLRIFPETLQYGGSGVSVVTITSTDNCNDRNVDVISVDPRATVFWWNEPTGGEMSADGKSILRHYTTDNGVEYDISLDKVPGGK